MTRLILFLLAAIPAFGSYGYVRKVVVPAAHVHSTETNFPVTIIGKFPYLATVANHGGITSANGYDLVFSSDAGCASLLNFKRIAWDAASGDSMFHVQIPALSNTNDNVFYECYGNSAVTTDQQSTATYDSTYIGVWPLANVGGTLDMSDQTSHGSNGTTSTATAGLGQLYGAAVFNGGSGVIVNHNATLTSPTNGLTISAWVNGSVLTQGNVSTILAQAFNQPNGPPYWSYYLSANDPSCQEFGGFNINGPNDSFAAAWSVSSAPDGLRILCSDPVDFSRMVPGQWYHLVFTYDGSHASFYVNGVLTSQNSVTGNLAYGTGNFGIGSSGDGTAGFQGAVDEASVSNVARSAGWVATQYDNELKPDQFYYIGPVITNSTQIANVSVTATNTQAVVQFTNTTGSAAGCSVEVSQNASMSPLVPDSDPSIFTGANLANRDDQNQVRGNSATVVVGKRYKAYYATAGDTSIRWSRALQASTTHFLDINCGGAEYEAPFTTNSLPFGGTRNDNIPADPAIPGNAMWQTWLDDTRCNANDTGCLLQGERRRAFATADVQTGVLMKSFVIPGDTALEIGNQQFFTYRNDAGWTVPSGWNTNGSAATYTGPGSGSTAKLFAVGMNANVLGFKDFNLPGYTVPVTLQFVINASISNPACDGNNTSDDCKIQACVSLDGVSCAPNAQTYDQVVSNSGATYRIGTGDDLDVLQKPGKHIWVRDEIARLQQPVSCSGNMVTIAWHGDALLAGTVINPGSLAQIDGTFYTVASVLNAFQFTTTTTPSSCGFLSYSDFSIAVWKKTATADTISVASPNLYIRVGGDASPQVAAGYISSPQDVTLPGNGHKAGIIRATAGVYAIDLENGDVYPYLNYAGSVQPPPGPSSGGNPIDATGAYWRLDGAGNVTKTVYTGDYQRGYIRTGNGWQYRVMLWEGNSSDSVPTCSSTITYRCTTTTQLSNSTYNLRSLLSAFDNRFINTTDSSVNPFQNLTFSGIDAGGVNGTVLNITFELNGSNGQNYAGWHLVFDPYATCNVNGTINSDGTCQAGSYGAGCIIGGQGCVVAARTTWGTPNARWTPDKGSIPSLMPGWMTDQGAPNGDNLGPGGDTGSTMLAAIVGSTFTSVSCPSGFTPLIGPYTGSSCIQLTVDGTPYDYVMGPTSRQFFGPYMVGDLAHINTPNPCAGFAGSCTFATMGGDILEIAQVTSASSGQYTLVLACINNSICPPDPGTTPATTLYMVRNFSSAIPPWSDTYGGTSDQIWWSWQTDPHGTAPLTMDLNGNHSHGFGVGGLLSGFYGAYYGNRDLRGDTVSQFKAGLDTLSPNGSQGGFSGPQGTQFLTGQTPVITQFNGISGSQGQYLNSHPDYGSFSTVKSDPAMGVDDPPVGGASNFPPVSAVHQAGSSASTYFVDAGWVTGNLILHQKQLDTQATSGPRVLRNISGPGSMITDGAGGYYTYCYVMLAGECWAGSSVNQVYFNIPYFAGLTNPINTDGGTCFGSGGFQAATATVDFWQPNDFCIYDAGTYNEHVRYYITGFDYTGWSKQHLGHNTHVGRDDIFAATEGANLVKDSPYQNWYYGNLQYLEGRFATILMKGPNAVPGSMDTARNSYSSVEIPVNVPSGADGAGIEIAYEDYQGYGSANRAETVIAVGSTVNQAVPWYWETTEAGAYTPTSCTHGTPCTVAAPVLWGHVARLTPVYFSGATIVGRGTTQIIPVQ